MAYDKMRELREDRDWTQQRVADLLFINRRTYSAYENGVNAGAPRPAGLPSGRAGPYFRACPKVGKVRAGGF